MVTAILGLILLGTAIVFAHYGAKGKFAECDFEGWLIVLCIVMAAAGLACLVGSCFP